MSDDLNLGAAMPATAAAPAQSSALVLTAPPPVQAVAPEEASKAIALAPETNTALDQRAVAFVESITALEAKSPEFTAKVTSISKMGADDIRRSSEVSNRMLDRPAVQGSPQSAQAKVGKTLADLRTQVTELDPNRADLTGIQKVLKWLPGGNKIDNYFNRYRSAQSHLDAIVRALASGQDELRKDNAAIEVERSLMWETMAKLREYDALADSIDRAIVAKIAQLRAAGMTEDADALESDVLFAVRQRRQDIMTQMAVNVQGYLALDLVHKNNEELIRGVDRAQTTTLSALRTAVIVSQALSQQELVLNQITALNSTTSDMIESTSVLLKQQGAAINRQAASATIEVDKLKAAFQNVFDTMDAIDTFRREANDSMAQTIGALEGQIEQSRTYVERSSPAQVASSQVNALPSGSGQAGAKKMPWE